MDGWRSAELRLLSPRAADALAAILRWVESYGRWPAELRTAKAVFLAKKQALSLGPTDYRALLILPPVYRRWAKTRARQLRGWMAGWRGRQQHTGPGSGGAESAWMGTALTAERAKLRRRPLLTTSLGIYKAFGQVQRKLLYVVLFYGGLPAGRVEAIR